VLFNLYEIVCACLHLILRSLSLYPSYTSLLYTLYHLYYRLDTMANKSKQFKKFASSGKLKETITKRRKDQQSRRKADDRTTRRAKQRGAPLEFGEEGEGSEDDEKDVRSANAAVGGRAGGVAKNVEELFGQGGLYGVDNGEGSDLEDLTEDDEESEEGEEEGEGEEDMLDEEAMKKAMKDLEKKDPEFFKYLKENDGDLLEFGNGKQVEEDDEDEDVEMGEDDEEEEDEEEEEEGAEEVEKKTSVTVKMVRQWQEGMIKVSLTSYVHLAVGFEADSQQHSLRSLRKTLLAFRTAAHMNEDDADQGTGLDTKYRIDSAQGESPFYIHPLLFSAWFN
jgi:nucleolar complex protein 2